MTAVYYPAKVTAVPYPAKVTAVSYPAKVTAVSYPAKVAAVLYPGKPQKQCYPFLLMCAVFLCVQTMVWLPAFVIFNVCMDVDAGDSTQGLYGHRKRVSTES